MTSAQNPAAVTAQAPTATAWTALREPWRSLAQDYLCATLTRVRFAPGVRSEEREGVGVYLKSRPLPGGVAKQTKTKSQKPKKYLPIKH